MRQSNLLLALALLVSCEQDVYEKGDSASSYRRADFVEAYANPPHQVEYVVTDDGDSLQLTAPYTGSWVQRPDTVYRAVLYYNQRGQQAEVLNFGLVATLVPQQAPEGFVKWKEDPVGLETVWLSRSKKYLNLGLLLKTGQTEQKNQMQAVGVVNLGTTMNTDSTFTCTLVLSHSQGNVPEYYTQRTYLSIPVEGLEADSLRFILNTYNGYVTRKFRL